MKQRSILQTVSIQGRALHSGQDVTLTLHPGEPDTGIVFQRNDLFGKPELRPRIELVNDELVRSTDITSGSTRLQTIEHVLSALTGCGIDNCRVELNASEPPILDGSARAYVELIQQAQPIEQEALRKPFVVEEPLSVTDGTRSLIALPHDGFRVTCTSMDDRGIHTQHLSLDLDPQTYIHEVAAARTFTIYEDIEPLLKMGKIQGGSLDSAIVIRGNQILSKEPLRFEDEFVRHKILDIVGDLALLGRPLKAHIVAVRPGHKLNSELTKALYVRMQAEAPAPAQSPAAATSATVGEGMAGPRTVAPMAPGQRNGQVEQRRLEKIIGPDEREVHIRRILDIMPHAYPFVMIDRIVDFPNEQELTAIKNVTINEPYFMGHFPGNPVMPGVLQLEAMAQAAGFLMLRKVSADRKMAYLMSFDKVKFRRAVVPGDQVQIKVQLVKKRGDKVGIADAQCVVDGKQVSSCQMMFTIMPVPEGVDV